MRFAPPPAGGAGGRRARGGGSGLLDPDRQRTARHPRGPAGQPRRRTAVARRGHRRGAHLPARPRGVGAPAAVGPPRLRRADAGADRGARRGPQRRRGGSAVALGAALGHQGAVGRARRRRRRHRPVVAGAGHPAGRPAARRRPDRAHRHRAARRPIGDHPRQRHRRVVAQRRRARPVDAAHDLRLPRLRPVVAAAVPDATAAGRDDDAPRRRRPPPAVVRPATPAAETS